MVKQLVFSGLYVPGSHISIYVGSQIYSPKNQLFPGINLW